MTTALGDLLPRLVHLLDASGVPFMVAGSVASTTYGVARSTQKSSEEWTAARAVAP